MKTKILHAIRRLFRANPIIIKEMRRHIRGPRAFIILSSYLLGLGLLAYGIYRLTLATANAYYGYGGVPPSAYIGQTLFVSLALLEMLFVCLITPAMTAGTISGEHERRTYDMLLSTPLQPLSILWGKVFASLVYIQLLILAAIPLSSIVFLFGGIALRDAIQAIGLLALTAMTYGVIGVFFSALTRRTGAATVLSYVVISAFISSSVLLWALTNTMNISGLPRQLLYLNPISALASAIVAPGMDFYSMGPAASLLILLGGGPDILGLSGTVSGPMRPLWQYTAAVYLALTAVLYAVTGQLIKPVRRWRPGWRGLLGWALVLALVIAGLLFIFTTTHGSTGWPTIPTPMPILAPPIVREVVVREAIEVPVEVPSPLPTPIPPPPPPSPFDAGEHKALIQNTLAANILLESGNTFCDVDILDSNSSGGYAQVSVWAYCRSFSVANGHIVPGQGISVPYVFEMSWTQAGEWQIGAFWIADVRNSLSPAAQQRLLERPYDEAAGEERLLEQARQALSGE